MKRPEYVAAAVTACRDALEGRPIDLEGLQSVFSRSGFTDGYYTGVRDLDMFGIRGKEDVTAAAGVLGRLETLYTDPRRQVQKVGIGLDFSMQAGGQSVLSVADCDVDVYKCSRNDKKNGTFERVVGDMVILCNYPDKYRKETKQGFKWLNENAAICDFDSLNDLLTRLTASIDATKETRALFNSKNGYIVVAAFKAFTEMGYQDAEFGRFLGWFVNGGSGTEIDGKTWNVLDTNHSTRDSGVVHGKVDYLVALMEKYFTETRKAA